MRGYEQVFGRIEAEVEVIGGTYEPMQRVVYRFLSRPEITTLRAPSFEAGYNSRAVFRVAYEAHGAWLCDIKRKITRDAAKVKVRGIREINPVGSRINVPERCPRIDCFACGEALKMRGRGIFNTPSCFRVKAA